ncbi:MAG TPA: AAA family ATPase, partial [Rhodocyclaceae bacterium]|nr:AAA family ATPase [Rhodocyclaceae bacterium]
CLSLGMRQLTDGGPALEAFSVERESGAQSRLEAAVALSPLVGRQEENAVLLAAWQEVKRGGRRAILLRGEAGIGKSRLVLTLKEALSDGGYRLRELQCSPESSHSPFQPLAAMFASILAFSPDESPEARFEKLAAYVESHYPPPHHQAVALLAKMLALPLRRPYRELQSSPQQQRQDAVALLADRVLALATRQPLLLVAEDLHWADPSLLEFLKALLSHRSSRPILILMTARPEFKPPWRSSLTRVVDLEPLDDEQTAALIATVAPRIAPETLRHLVERADGIPLFAEELAREALAGEQTAIPATLQDLLTARLDNLGPAKAIAQYAATVGREFDPHVLAQASGLDRTALARLLDQLREAGLLARDGRGAWRFRHALIRDAAYDSQTKAERAMAHRCVAATLAASEAHGRPELLAQHWAAGGEFREAVACWTRAGKLASQRSAYREALAHFRSARELLHRLPDGTDRLELELDLQIGLGAAACAVQGYASPEGAAAYARTMALCRQRDSAPELFPALWGFWGSASSRDGYDHALELAVQLLRVANQGHDPVHVQQAHFALGNTLFWRGEFALAREHLERVQGSYDLRFHDRHVADFGEDPGVTSGAYLSWVLWVLGRTGQAQAVSERSQVLARQLGHPISLAYALGFAAILQCRLRRPAEALALAKETLELANSHGFALWRIAATLTQGWARSMQGDPEGVESMRHCVDATRAAMGGVTLAVLEPLTDACVRLGRFAAALETIDEALGLADTLGDHHADAELYRLRGEALLGSDRRSRPTEAEASLSRALAVSRQQQAKSLELRAATSLARLWRDQNRRDDARQLLADICRQFPADATADDSHEAANLLDSLAARPGKTD